MNGDPEDRELGEGVGVAGGRNWGRENAVVRKQGWVATENSPCGCAKLLSSQGLRFPFSKIGG